MSESESFTERDVLAYGQRRWRRVQFLADEFWRMWHDNYLQELTFRRKWRREAENLMEGDVVMLREKNVPRRDWRMGIVSKPLPGTDGLVRRVLVTVINTKGRRKETERSITDIVLLHRP